MVIHFYVLGKVLTYYTTGLEPGLNNRRLYGTDYLLTPLAAFQDRCAYRQNGLPPMVCRPQCV